MSADSSRAAESAGRRARRTGTRGGESGRLRLVGDIGGTNARFALAKNGAVGEMTVLPTHEHATFEDTIRVYLGGLPAAGPIREAVFAIAGPVGGDRVTFTNRPEWSFSVARLRSSLGFDRLDVVNDFTANALALPYLAPDDCERVGGGTAVAGGPMAILGPGTGLGVSGLVPADGRWIALAGEGGHATLPASTARESAVIELLRRKYGHVSAERILSGQGLADLYDALAAIDGDNAPPLAPAEVTEAALDGTDARARETVETFCAVLGTVAGDLALTLGATGGVYVAGGIVPRLGTVFAASPFRKRFENKGRMSGYTAAIPTFVVTHRAPAMVGLANLP
jgi:glucokinase